MPRMEDHLRQINDSWATPTPSPDKILQIRETALDCLRALVHDKRQLTGSDEPYVNPVEPHEHDDSADRLLHHVTRLYRGTPGIGGVLKAYHLCIEPVAHYAEQGQQVLDVYADNAVIALRIIEGWTRALAYEGHD